MAYLTIHPLNLNSIDTNDLMLKIFSGILKNENQTKKIAEKISQVLLHGDTVLLKGKLGTGKTLFTKFIIRSLFGVVDVTSPTFNLVKVYQSSQLSLWHCDFYRLKKSSESEELGVFDDLERKITIIEWPEIAKDYFQNDELEIYLDYFSPSSNKRNIDVFGSQKWSNRLKNLNF